MRAAHWLTASRPLRPDCPSLVRSSIPLLATARGHIPCIQRVSPLRVSGQRAKRAARWGHAAGHGTYGRDRGSSRGRLPASLATCPLYLDVVISAPHMIGREQRVLSSITKRLGRVAGQHSHSLA